MQQILMPDAASLFAMTALCKGEGGKAKQRVLDWKKEKTQNSESFCGRRGTKQKKPFFF
jgi:hypothetical protein